MTFDTCHVSLRRALSSCSNGSMETGSAGKRQHSWAVASRSLKTAVKAIAADEGQLNRAHRCKGLMCSNRGNTPVGE